MHLYFKNKEALFKAVVRESLLPNLERAEQRFDQRAFVEQHADFLLRALAKEESAPA